MNQPAIIVEELWKEYAIGAAQARHDTFYDVLASAVKAPLRRMRELGGSTREEQKFWALRGVDFQVAQGEVLGIIGRNGAGKSTLLKILSRVTAPSRGRVTIAGRMASLLEVGTGFHPELSGRENVYLNGALLGMTRADIDRKFDAIVAFAEVERFIDTPVKRYSSGMYVRLAFSVAAHLEPDILVIDEVLAVGDAQFQQKCLGKLEDSRSQGRTVVIVSHNLPMIRRLCSVAVWLDQGVLMAQGDIDKVSAQYLSSSRVASSVWTPTSEQSPDFCYRRISISAPMGSAPESIAASQPFSVDLEYSVLREELVGRISFLVRNQRDEIVFTSTNTDASPFQNLKWTRGVYHERCEIPGHLLMPGVYYLTVSEPLQDGNVIHDNICSFEISATDSLVGRDGRYGAVAPMLHWERSP